MILLPFVLIALKHVIIALFLGIIALFLVPYVNVYIIKTVLKGI